MAPRRKTLVVEEQLTLPLEQVQEAVLPGDILPSLDQEKAMGTIGVVLHTGIGEVAKSWEVFLDKTPEQLVTLVSTIKGQALAKQHIKECSSLRSALDRAHKDAKAPFLNIGRQLDSLLKTAKEQVLEYEAPIKAAIATYEGQQAAAAAKAQATKLAELEAENAKMKALLEKAEVIPEFEAAQVVRTIQGRDAYTAAKQLFGDAYNEVKTDANGTNYLLEVVLRRKEVQDE